MLSFVQSPRRLLTANNIINGLSSKVRELENKLQQVEARRAELEQSLAALQADSRRVTAEKVEFETRFREHAAKLSNSARLAAKTTCEKRLGNPTTASLLLERAGESLYEKDSREADQVLIGNDAIPTQRSGARAAIPFQGLRA